MPGGLGSRRGVGEVWGMSGRGVGGVWRVFGKHLVCVWWSILEGFGRCLKGALRGVWWEYLGCLGGVWGVSWGIPRPLPDPHTDPHQTLSRPPLDTLQIPLRPPPDTP